MTKPVLQHGDSSKRNVQQKTSKRGRKRKASETSEMLEQEENFGKKIRQLVNEKASDLNIEESASEQEEMEVFEGTSKGLEKESQKRNNSRTKNKEKESMMETILELVKSINNSGKQRSQKLASVAIPMFNNQPDSFLDWVSQMKIYLRSFEMNREEQIDAIISGLPVNTRKYLGKKCREMTVDQVFEKLGKAFDYEEEGKFAAISGLRQQPDESVGDFFMRVGAAMENFNENEHEKEKGITDVFVAGLRNDIAKRMRDVKLNSSKEALSMALKNEKKTTEKSAKAVKSHQDEISELMAVHQKRAPTSDQTAKGSKSKIERLCFFCKKPGHTYNYCFRATKEQKEEIRRNLPKYLKEAREANQESKNQESRHLNSISVSMNVENSQLAPK